MWKAHVKQEKITFLAASPNDVMTEDRGGAEAGLRADCDLRVALLTPPLLPPPSIADRRVRSKESQWGRCRGGVKDGGHGGAAWEVVAENRVKLRSADSLCQKTWSSNRSEQQRLLCQIKAGSML